MVPDVTHTTAMSNKVPTQDEYARLLSSFRGYPLWTPEPSNELLMERNDGLRIGDVGIVLKDGGFDPLFNICFPEDHPFHLRHGVPEGFTCIHPSRLDIRTNTNAEPPKYLISSSSVTRIKTPGSLNDVAEGDDSNTFPYRFNLFSAEGAALVLPKGAESCDLLNEELFLEQASRHGEAWYEYAVNRRGRVINPDSLYLITGFHKTLAWSAAVFESASPNECHTACLRQIERNNRPPTYSWDASCALEWRAAPETGPHIEHSIPNQAVFIRGFKIALRSGLLGRRWVSVEADSPSTPSRSPKLSSFVPSSSPILDGLAGLLDAFSLGNSYLPTTTRSEGVIDVDEERPQSSTSNHSGHDGTRVKIQRIPDAPPPFHPADAINRYLLDKDPFANIAVTHDSHWMSLLKDNSLMPEDLEDESSLETALSQKYDIISREGVVYLERKPPQSASIHPSSTLKKKAFAKIDSPLSCSEEIIGDYKKLCEPFQVPNLFPAIAIQVPSVITWDLRHPPVTPYVRSPRSRRMLPYQNTDLTGPSDDDLHMSKEYCHWRTNARHIQESHPCSPGHNISIHHSLPHPKPQISLDTTSIIPLSFSPSSSPIRDSIRPVVDDPELMQFYCGWFTDERMCRTQVGMQDIRAHLRDVHGVLRGSSEIRCRWGGCDKEMSRENITRHVRERHLGCRRGVHETVRSLTIPTGPTAIRYSSSSSLTLTAWQSPYDR